MRRALAERLASWGGRLAAASPSSQGVNAQGLATTEAAAATTVSIDLPGWFGAQHSCNGSSCSRASPGTSGSSANGRRESSSRPLVSGQRSRRQLLSWRSSTSPGHGIPSTAAVHTQAGDAEGALQAPVDQPWQPQPQQQQQQQPPPTPLQQQQYAVLVSQLQAAAQGRDLSRVARAFDPAALDTAPDGGAAMLEALMHGAARAGDAPLTAELAQTMRSRGLRLSAAAHRALLHVLSKGGRRGEAADWLTNRVPPDLLSWEHIAAVARPAEQEGDTETLARALAVADARGVSDPDFALAGSRLVLASAGAGGAGAVEAAWQGILQQLGQEGRAPSPELLSRRVFALHKATKESVREGYAPLLAAANELLDTLEAESQAALKRASQQGANGSAGAAADASSISSSSSGGSSSAASLEGVLAALLPQGIAAPEAGDAAGALLGLLGDRGGAGAYGQPGPVSSWGLLSPAQESAIKALDAAAAAAAAMVDVQGAAALAARRAALGLPLSVPLFRSQLELALWGHGTPEALEALIGEMLGWGLLPDARCYEQLAEAYALHGAGYAAVGVLDRMEAAGITPRATTYRRLLHGLGPWGDLDLAMKVYARFKASGLPPSTAILGRLFRIVRNHAQLVRTDYSRRKAALAPGDIYGRRSIVAHRRARLAGAYVHLLSLQSDMVASGVRHDAVTLHHLLRALDRVNAVSDCIQLAQVYEDRRPGDMVAHKVALKAAGRMRTPAAAGHTQQLAARLEEGGSLSPQEYNVLLFSQFWLHGDGDKVLDTFKSMQRQGIPPEAWAAHQLIYMLCASRRWDDALAVLTSFDQGAAPSAAAAPGRHAAAPAEWRRRRYLEVAVAPALQQGAGQRRASRLRSGAAGSSGSSGGGDTVDSGEGDLLSQDALWHIVLRHLVHESAPDGVVTEFVSRMEPALLRRFARMYPLRKLPSGGYSLSPEERLGSMPAAMREGTAAAAAASAAAAAAGPPRRQRRGANASGGAAAAAAASEASSSSGSSGDGETPSSGKQATGEGLY